MLPVILWIKEKYRKGNILDELKAQKVINKDLFHESFTALKSIGRTDNNTELSCWWMLWILRLLSNPFDDLFMEMSVFACG